MFSLHNLARANLPELRRSHRPAKDAPPCCGSRPPCLEAVVSPQAGELASQLGVCRRSAGATARSTQRLACAASRGAAAGWQARASTLSDSFAF